MLPGDHSLTGKVDSIRLVTLDCWNTLLIPVESERARRGWAKAVGRVLETGLDEAQAVWDLAWERHVREWKARRSFTNREIAAWIAERTGHGHQMINQLADSLNQATLEMGVRIVPGARSTLEELARRGIRLALVSDTGVTSSDTIRLLLDEHGVLPLLAHLAFSDEVGVPKPDSRIFHAALSRTGVRPSEAAHVGDLRRHDVVGARQAGMLPVRFRGVLDDPDGPEADILIDRLEELLVYFPGSRSRRD